MAKGGLTPVGTVIPVAKSQAAISLDLEANGASCFSVRQYPSLAVVSFRLAGQGVHLEMPMATSADFLKPKTEPRGWWLWDDVRKDAWRRKQADQAQREAWRLLALFVRSALELGAFGRVTIVTGVV